MKENDNNFCFKLSFQDFDQLKSSKVSHIKAIFKQNMKLLNVLKIK